MGSISCAIKSKLTLCGMFGSSIGSGESARQLETRRIDVVAQKDEQFRPLSHNLLENRHRLILFHTGARGALYVFQLCSGYRVPPLPNFIVGRRDGGVSVKFFTNSSSKRVEDGERCAYRASCSKLNAHE